MSLISCDEVFNSVSQLLGTPYRSVVLTANPVPASRPRVTRWGTYYAKTYKTWRDQVYACLKEQTDVLDNSLTVLVRSNVLKPKTSKKDHPRGDADNYAKGPLDVLTQKKFWVDDDLIVNLLSSKKFISDGQEPHTEVYIYVHKKK